MRKDVDSKVPEGQTPEKQAEAVEKRRAALALAIRGLRTGAQPGSLFTSEGALQIQRQLKGALGGPGSATIRDALEEQNDPSVYKTQSPAVAINGTVLAPLVPGVLLADLPPVPEQVEYHFIGRMLVLTDAQAAIVLDYVPNAFPEEPPKSAEGGATAMPAPRTTPFLRMPRKSRSVRFAVLGDTGTGDLNQQKVADTLWEFYSEDNRFKFILLLGDNLYAARESADDYQTEFVKPYQKFLDARIKFYATLGNHDLAGQVDFPPFNMGGKQHYSFTEGNAKFVSLNSSTPTDPEQLAWFDKQFSNDAWRICFFHHPLYSSGLHSLESREIRRLLEDHLIKNKVNVVFSGHEHFYERPKPQHDINYFVSGAAAKLRIGDLHPQDFTAFGYDREHSFMIVEIAGDQMFWQTMGESGRTIDCGVLYRTQEAAASDVSRDDTTKGWLEACGRSRAWLSPHPPTNAGLQSREPVTRPH